MKKSIAIDMDDTVADTLSRHLDWYESRFGVTLNRQDLHGKKIYDVVGENHRDAVQQHPHDPAFFEDLPVFEHAAEVIQNLNQSYTIYFVSAAMEYPSSFNAKYLWLRKHFPFISSMNYVFCGFKGMLNCDYLIDDSSRHLDAFSGKGFLYDSPSNTNERGYDRVHNWLEVQHRFETSDI